MQTGASAQTTADEARLAVPQPAATPALLIGVPKETAPGEKRVATVPEVVVKLVKLGFRVAVGCGTARRASSAVIWAEAPVCMNVFSSL